MFYHISDRPSNRYKYVNMKMDYYQLHTYRCNTCGRTVQKTEIAYWPPKFSFAGGKRYPDCLCVAIVSEEKCGIIVSQKALDAFQAEHLTGFEATAIEIADPKADGDDSNEMPQYYYLYVHGSISLDYHAMHYKKKNVCSDCGSYNWSREKIGESFLDLSSWNGCDICKLTDYPNLMICTQKVIEVIKKYNLKGFTQCGASDIFRPLKAQKVC